MNAAQLKREIARAAEKDPGLQKLIAALGAPKPRKRAPGFATLLHVIVSQQLATKAADAIWQRLLALCRGEITHRKILRRGEAQLRRCGLSRQKSDYALGLARMVASKELNLDALPKLARRNSEAAIAELLKVRGIGRWSAEIYLMFALGHKDVFPAGDFALQVALQRYLRRKQQPKEKETAAIAERWAPHRSSVALLMWNYYSAPPV